eukprot:TRINITY_DN382_c0_g2_i2.p1 TRINITY_DN382_c0_g2~~TRINITY_DN382_c0_g2_i2.p1  ORF type:complete len:278 (-),score=57.44 TRINITY_DN382_c0_g2_i2:196-1029(-)
MKRKGALKIEIERVEILEEQAKAGIHGEFWSRVKSNSCRSFNIKDFTKDESVVVERDGGRCAAVEVYTLNETGEKCLLKKMMCERPQERDSIERELAIYTSDAVACDYIVPFLGLIVDEENDLVQFVLKYIRGGSLKSKEITEETSLARICKSALTGLHALEKCGFVHSDIKPGNILLGEEHRCMIVDFGCAVTIGDYAVGGTRKYFSPEREFELVSAKEDIWAFGKTVIDIAKGYDEGGYSGTFYDFVSKCVESDVEQRFSASQLLAHAFLDGVTL